MHSKSTKYSTYEPPKSQTSSRYFCKHSHTSFLQVKEKALFLFLLIFYAIEFPFSSFFSFLIIFLMFFKFQPNVISHKITQNMAQTQAESILWSADLVMDYLVWMIYCEIKNYFFPFLLICLFQFAIITINIVELKNITSSLFIKN